MALVVTHARRLPTAFPIVYETPRTSYFTAFALFVVAICLVMGLAGLVSSTAEQSLLPAWAWFLQMAVLSASSAALSLMYLNRLHVVVTDCEVTLAVTGLIGTERWQEPLSAYDGIVERATPAVVLPSAGDAKGFRMMLHEILLRHRGDPAKDVKLLVRFTFSAERAWDEEQLQVYCRLLKKPKLPPIAEPERTMDLLALFSG